MGQRLDAVVPRPQRDGKTWWHKVGSAWVNDEGKITLYLDSLPIPVPDPNIEGKMNVIIHLFEPREQGAAPAKGASGTRQTKEEAKKGAGKGKPAGNRSLKEELDDEIPF